ncbi:type II toxin-antitoxin system VapB family antitoxin [Herbaspirillum huttiense]|uniref:Type II toxin-antitoxin system VapB family antitoxin n=2 Tax=Herbaspirillum huttiense TaxID=863372 RepID=A0AAJ2LUU5_9BURK|nr:type II toxin-antitoxin system VapB family antitoxin [Herbaspirillum huttiense]MDR9837650.1 type II toxin-antitoxin system VapB family antitoxin [Herbaspirillum huttiense]
MRTNIEIDVDLMKEVQLECNINSKKQAIDLALRTLLRLNRQESIGQHIGNVGSDNGPIDLTLLETVMRECNLKSTTSAIELGLRSILRIIRQNSVRQLSGARGHDGDIVWSPASEMLFDRLRYPIDERVAVNYDRRRLDDYLPNVDFMLPPELAHELLQASTAAVGHPDSTKEVSDLLMMDFIWGGVRLRGNGFSRCGARNVLSSDERRYDSDTIDLLGHWAAYMHLIWGIRGQELTCERIREIREQHVSGIFAPEKIGRYRQHATNIPHTRYSPPSNERMLVEMMDILIQKACSIINPIEAAFFLWLHLAYLHPFDTANHRTSRTAMNIPLLKACLVPITFVNVDRTDYQKAMFGFFEFGDISIAADLFVWTYMQSARRYAGFCIEGAWSQEYLRR